MKVLLAAPFAINSPHYETALELMQLHLDQGDEVLMLECDAALFSCDANPYHAFSACVQCIGRRKAGLRLLSRPVRTAPVFRLDEEDRRAMRSLPLEFPDAETLRRQAIDGFDLGRAALSSLISALRSSEPDFGDPAVRRLARRLALTACAVYCSFRNYLASDKPDRVYVYNGRYAPTRAVLRACQQAGVECLVHEVGSTLQHYALFRNCMPHEILPAEERAREAWSAAQSDPAARERAATAYYEELSRGVVGTWFAYTKDQEAGLLPQGWDESKTNIVIFNSSEDEFAAFEEWRSPIYGTQIQGLRSILESVGGDDRLRLYLRLHPRLRDVRDSFTASLAQLGAPNFTLIPADSPISSYALMAKADKVVTFGSSIGIEATFWGKPSILAGMSMYRHLGATHNPGSHVELVDMLHANLAPAPKEGALIYGHYRRTFGVPFKYFRATGVFEGEFKSVRLQPPPAERLLAGAAQALGLGTLSLRWHARKVGVYAKTVL